MAVQHGWQGSYSVDCDLCGCCTPLLYSDFAGAVTTLPASVERDILDHRIMFAITAIREALGCTIYEAIDVFAARNEELRRDRPDDFTVAPEEYGRGFYS